MKNHAYILAVDQGSSATKALVFDKNGFPAARGNCNLNSYYPQPGFVEQKQEEIYYSVLTVVKECHSRLQQKDPKAVIAACGIANQRETFCLWDKEGRPLHNAVGWLSRNSAAVREALDSGRAYFGTVSSAFGWSDFDGLLEFSVPITALAGDSHSAAYGECCFSPGEAKVTIGTGSSGATLK